jgi:HK97 gp10 family phage protein
MARVGGKFKVEGIESLNRELDRLPDRIRRNITAVALRKAGRIIRDSARKYLVGRPYGAGFDDLSKSLGTKMERVPRGAVPVVQIGARRKMRHARVAHLVEFGHGGPHAANAHPYLEPGIQDAKQSAVRAIRDELAAWLKLVRF